MSLPRFPPHRKISGRDANLLMDYLESAVGGQLPPSPTDATTSSPLPPGVSGGVRSITTFPPLSVSNSTGDVFIQDTSSPYFVNWSIWHDTGITTVFFDPFNEVALGGWTPKQNCYVLATISLLLNESIAGFHLYTMDLDATMSVKSFIRTRFQADFTINWFGNDSWYYSDWLDVFAGGVVTPSMGVVNLDGSTGPTITHYGFTVELLVVPATIG